MLDLHFLESNNLKMVKINICDYLICSEVDGLVNHTVSTLANGFQDMESLVNLVLLHTQVIPMLNEAVTFISPSGAAIAVLHS